MTPDEVQAVLDLGLNGVLIVIVVILWRHVLTLNAEIKELNEKLSAMAEKLAEYHDAIVIPTRKYIVNEIINTSD